MEKTQLSIIIIDDHEIVTRGIAQIVRESLPDADLRIECVTSGCRALELMAREDFGLCILDIEMPDIDGLGILKIIRAEHPHTKIIVNTIHEELWYVRDYIHARAEGILFKSVKAAEISEAVRTVVSGGTYFCARAKSIARIIGGYNPPSSKEIEVLRLIAAGNNTETVARLLGLSVNTVESHRRHLLDKLEARNVAELVMNAISQGILPVK